MSFTAVVAGDLDNIVADVRLALAVGNKNAIKTTTLERILAVCESLHSSSLANRTEDDGLDGRVVQS